jgi:hypothetical protein
LVAIDPRNGEVLAMVSKPGYDINLFIGGIDQENWDLLNTSIDRPLLNRALRGTYPPGSTYKPFMGLAGLESGKRKIDTTIQDNGSWTFGGHTFRSGHPNGPTNLRRSIIKSSNVYYYMLANDMGVDLIHDYLSPMGFGRPTGIDLEGESPGVLPSMQWKRNTYKRPEQKRWYAGETISLGIGQGYNHFTMLQLALATGVIANDGIKMKPHLVKEVVDVVTRTSRETLREIKAEAIADPKNIAVIRNALVGVNTEGTGATAFRGAGYVAAGKTGTAQVVAIKQNEKYNAARMAERLRDHALYMAFAPMALMDFIKKQFIDIIQWTEDGDGTLAWRFPMAGMEIQNGGTLVVRESQMAVFVNEGQVADVFGPGTYKLTTQTLPVLTYLKNWDKLFESPFKSDVYFFSTRQQIDQKWGTPQPITIRDKDFGAVRLRAFGNYAFRIADPKLFHTEISGTRESYPWPTWTGSCAAWCCKTSATPLPAAACRSWTWPPTR